MRPKVIFIAGPTAVGKSAVALALCRKLKARIISCDSMQVYKRMDIISSKPPLAIRKKYKHYLIDIASPAQEYDAARYRRQAINNIRLALKEKKLPLFVGGTGLYISLLIDGIFKGAPENKAVRNRLFRQAQLKGSRYLHQKLSKLDPQAAQKIHPNDLRRIVRALEVLIATGKPISLLQKKRRGLSGEYDLYIFCLNMRRDKLYQRIDRRVGLMFRQGLAAEVKKLLESGLGRTAGCAIGIGELKGYFDGKYDLNEAKRLIKRNSRRYAKRQISWFKRDKRARWVNIKDKDSPAAIAERIIKLWKKPY